MNPTFIKSLFMTIVVFIATTIFTTGMPASALAWEILGITTGGTVLGYIAQSLALPTTSIVNNINLKDLVKGAILAVANM